MICMPEKDFCIGESEIRKKLFIIITKYFHSSLRRKKKKKAKSPRRKFLMKNKNYQLLDLLMDLR